MSYPNTPVVLFFADHPRATRSWLRRQVVYPRHPGDAARARRRLRERLLVVAAVLLGAACFLGLVELLG